MTEIKRVDVREFRAMGLIQEINRLFLHPLGMAIEVIIHEDGSETLGGIWDFRDDPEGIAFQDGVLDPEKAKHFAELFESKRDARERGLGWHIQPIEEEDQDASDQ